MELPDQKKYSEKSSKGRHILAKTSVAIQNSKNMPPIVISTEFVIRYNLLAGVNEFYMLGQRRSKYLAKAQLNYSIQKLVLQSFDLNTNASFSFITILIVCLGSFAICSFYGLKLESTGYSSKQWLPSLKADSVSTSYDSLRVICFILI